MSGFTVINNSIFNDNNLSMQEKFMLIVLKTFDHKREGIVFPSYEKLMELSGIGRRNNISKLIKALQEKGYIIIGRKGRVNTYRFVKYYLLSDTNKAKESSNINNTIDSNKDNNRNRIDTNEEKNSNNGGKDKEIISIHGDTNERNVSNSIVTSKNRTSNNGDTSISNNGGTNKNGISTYGDTSISNNVDTYISNHVDTLKIKEKNTKEKYNIYSDLNNNYIFNKSSRSINSC